VAVEGHLLPPLGAPPPFFFVFLLYPVQFVSNLQLTIGVEIPIFLLCTLDNRNQRIDPLL
jgi:hypothetical protein